MIQQLAFIANSTVGPSKSCTDMLPAGIAPQLITTVTATGAYDVGFGIFSVVSHETSRWRNPNSAPDTSEDFRLQINFAPRPSSKAQGFRATVKQYHGEWGTFQTVPRLCFNNIIPASSPIFQVVQEGRFEKFKEMLMLGEASLRDHDEFGASLLFVSSNISSLLRIIGNLKE